MMDAVKSVTDKDEVVGFMSPVEALAYAQQNRIDVAFLDLEMPEIDGVRLAKWLKRLNPDVNLIFATAYREYGVEAMELRASGYLLKPVTECEVRRELMMLRFPPARSPQGIRAATFGNFELLKDGVPVVFNRSKSKELLAYLIDNHGEGMSKKELAGILFEDRKYDRNCQDYMNKIVRDLYLSLEEAGAKDILIRRYNYYAVDTAKISCDLYEYENGDPMAVNAFHGEYMKQYSWGEYTLGRLCQ